MLGLDIARDQSRRDELVVRRRSIQIRRVEADYPVNFVERPIADWTVNVLEHAMAKESTGIVVVGVSGLEVLHPPSEKGDHRLVV